ncbi:MAG: hypothetical protein KOO66_09395 [Bacteroidales bacterium]|nr:hypothetical protein [Bacteroidales bacterium]
MKKSHLITIQHFAIILYYLKFYTTCLKNIFAELELVNKSLPVKIQSKSGYIEREIHDLINARNPKYAHTSYHKPISIIISESN